MKTQVKIKGPRRPSPPLLEALAYPPTALYLSGAVSILLFFIFVVPHLVSVLPGRKKKHKKPDRGGQQQRTWLSWFTWFDSKSSSYTQSIHKAQRMGGSKHAKKDVQKNAGADQSSNSTDNINAQSSQHSNAVHNSKESTSKASGSTAAPAPAGPPPAGPSSMRKDTKKGPIADVIAAAAANHQDSQLMLLAAEIGELRTLYKHITMPNKKQKDMGFHTRALESLQAKLQQADGLVGQTVHLVSLRLNLNDALCVPQGRARVAKLTQLVQAIECLTAEAKDRGFQSMTAFAMLAFCLTEMAREEEDARGREFCSSSLLKLCVLIKRGLGGDGSGLCDTSGWLDPEHEAVVEIGSKTAMKLDRLEGEDMSARLRYRLAFIDTLLKQALDSEGAGQQSRSRKVGGRVKDCLAAGRQEGRGGQRAGVRPGW